MSAGAEVKGRPLKAYRARSYDGESDAVVFSRRNDMAARREAAGQMPSGDIEDIESMVRAPEFDDLAHEPGPMTTQQYIARGWWFECSGCFRRVNADMDDHGQHEGDDYDADGRGINRHGELLEPSFHVLIPEAAWCCGGCRDRDRARNFRERVEACDEHERWTTAARERWPGISRLSLFRQEWDKPHTLRVMFQAPGFDPYHYATWHPLEPSGEQLFVTRAAIGAWHAYEAALMNAANRDPGDECWKGQSANPPKGHWAHDGRWEAK